MTGGTHKEEWRIEGAVEGDNPSVFFHNFNRWLFFLPLAELYVRPRLSFDCKGQKLKIF